MCLSYITLISASEMTYIVSGGALNSTNSTHHTYQHSCRCSVTWWFLCV